ncbi:Gfo/Idh/MocA family oxidoreductase [Alloacidobacterium dinghuense]|uniref:Gfo/Idh/MocA family oxidoreductase n=1 Tax=Alloacidobacterium dinghuense TaxID=2763107 RepID=A0A7G8BIS6_9BACT|nr:Gfo/Idh/MocA family oxidoreductase [Alloacidobacterium dinghuense]QNI32446.1 Gfo/Idh/MocA family oxidoreductase [Alloacidobacterium dinghuense]
MKKIGMGLVGPGFVGAHHIDAVRRLGDVDVVAIAGSSRKSVDQKARAYKVERAYDDYRALIADPDIHVIHNTTPNHLHFPVIMAALAAGKHVISDKPLAVNADEGRQLHEAAVAAKVANVVTFNYRGNPLVQQARLMIAKGDAGDLSFVHGFYLQDWMTNPNVFSWRSDPTKGGVSSALGDIGSHWCDLAEHVSGLKIDSVLADLTTVIPVRYSSSASAEAFSKESSGERTPVQVGAEDLASVLLRFENGTRGSFSVGQVLPGHKNDVQLEINGRKLSLKWRQEEQNELWIGHQDKPNCVMMKDPSLVLPEVQPYVHLPGGHQEAWSDAFFNLIRDAYDWVRGGAAPDAKPALLPTFADGYRSTRLVEAMLKSHAAGGVWTKIQPA